ncbi:hypothetical protein RP20_CCG018950 [Aedes albopictus]|nr:hypothetical protein RP20_CCG018950 [Aedes albopictus]
MKYVFAFIVALGLVSHATALSCFVCNSVEDGTCDGEQLVECDALSAATGMALLVALKPTIQILPSTNYKCFKLVAEAKQSSSQVAIKSCIYDTVAVCEGTIANADQKECYTCEEDGCNGSGRLRTSYMALLGLVVISWIFGNKY